MKPLLLLFLSASLFAMPQKQLFGVKSVNVVKETTAQHRTYYGHLLADESRIHSVSPRFGGYATKLYADRTFARVEAGQTLARVYSPEVLRAKEEYRNALLYDRQHRNASMVQSARKKLRLLGLPEAEITLAEKSGNIEEETAIYAPSTGFVFAKNLNPGSAFPAGKELFTIVDTSRLWVESAIYQNELGRIDDFVRYEVRAEGLEQWFPAKRPNLLPQMPKASGTATLRLHVENPALRLFPGMYCEVRAYTQTREHLLIPRTAAIRKHGSWYVFSEGEFEGEYEPLEVVLRPFDEKRYEVISGLQEGDTIVDDALFLRDADAQINGLY